MNLVTISLQCAVEVNANWEEIQKCSKSREGTELLKAHGEETHSLKPSMTFVPTIVINKNQGNQRSILKNLFKEVCSIYAVSHICNTFLVINTL